MCGDWRIQLQAWYCLVSFRRPSAFAVMSINRFTSMEANSDVDVTPSLRVFNVLKSSVEQESTYKSPCSESAVVVLYITDQAEASEG